MRVRAREGIPRGESPGVDVVYMRLNFLWKF